MTFELPPAIAGLIDQAPIHDAQAEIAEARRRHREAADAVLAADADLEEARAAIPALVDRAVAGERVSAATVARAHVRVRDAERYRAFLYEVVNRLHPDEREGDLRLSRAREQAYSGVLQHGIDLQIKAAERGDRAGGTVDRLPDRAELAAAKAAFEAASRIVAFAIQSGARPVQGPVWPISAHQLRRVWGREEVTQEAA